MFEIGYNDDGEVALKGRLDASSANQAAAFLNDLSQSTVLNLAALEYISSAGLGVLLATQQRFMETNQKGLKLVKLNRHVSDVFRISGFEKVFEIDFGT